MENSNRSRKNIDRKAVVLIGIALCLAAVLIVILITFDHEQRKPNPATDETAFSEQTTGPVFSEEQTTVSEDGTGETQKPTDGTDTTEPSGETTPIPVKTDAAYERWLAAAMVIGISMEYPDFEIQGIYIASETQTANKFDSEGAYVVFSSGGENFAIQSKPLEAERTQAGTVDLYTGDLGFSTFDKVSVEQMDLSAMEAVEAEELNELIGQSILVSLYAH